jgi:anti-sigma factor RsiW
MNGRVIRFEGPVHAQADRLLPWYVNGTLQADERAQVEQHLVECPSCQQEADWLRAVQSQFAAQAAQEEGAPGAGRAHRRIGRPHGAAPPRFVWRRRERRLAWLAALQAAVVLALGATLLRQPSTSYRTLGAPADRGALLVVVFDTQTREAQMRELVRASGARIVGGPSAEGAYVLRVPSVRAEAARKLLAGSSEVTLVEDLSSGGNP